MIDEPRLGKRERTRRRIADEAAALFAERGYDAVSVLDVARAAEVSEQTVYNHFPAKHDLVLDLAERIRSEYAAAVRERGPGVGPAAALAPFVVADVDRYRHADLDRARGDFLALVVDSPVLRRAALDERERQTHAIAAALRATDRALPPVLARAYAAALVAAVQAVHDRIGEAILARSPQAPSARRMRTTVQQVFAGLDRAYDALTP